MALKMDEKALNKIFVEKVLQSLDFQTWLLSRTKFKDRACRVVLARSDNPWYRSKLTGKDSETDILLVFEPADGTDRFALHVENKTPAVRGFEPNQPQNYHARASDWVGVAKWGNYRDYEFGLIAPLSFAAVNRAQCRIFHWYLPYEDLSAWIPVFGL